MSIEITLHHNDFAEQINYNHEDICDFINEIKTLYDKYNTGQPCRPPKKLYVHNWSMASTLYQYWTNQKRFLMLLEIKRIQDDTVLTEILKVQIEIQNTQKLNFNVINNEYTFDRLDIKVLSYPIFSQM